MLGLLDAPDVGEVHCDGRRIDNLKERQRDTLRNRNFGFIFQSYHLLPEFTLLENVLSPLAIRHSTLSWWRHRKAFREQAREIIDKVGHVLSCHGGILPLTQVHLVEDGADGRARL